MKLETHPVESTNRIYAVMEDGKAVEICRTPANKETDKVHARRIVACWNACEGIETGILETLPLNFKQHAEELERVNSKLAALEHAHSKGNLWKLTSERIDASIRAEQLQVVNERLLESLKNFVLIAENEFGVDGNGDFLGLENSQYIERHREARAAIEYAEFYEKDIETVFEEGVPYSVNLQSTHPDPSQPAQVIANLTRKLGDAIKALRMIATYQPETGQCDNGYSPKYMAESVIATYGTGPVIQERPRPEGEWRFEVEE